MKYSLHREIALVLTGQFLQLASAFATGILIARSLSPTDYGVLNILKSLFGAISLIAPLGLDVGLLKFCGSGSDELEVGKLIPLLRKFVLLVNALIAVLVGGALSGPIMRHFYPYDGFDLLLPVTMIALPVSADIAVMGAVMKSRGEAAAYAFLTQYLQSALRLALVGLVALSAPSLAGYVWINVAQCAASGGAILFHDRGRARLARSCKGVARWDIFRRVLLESGWMAMTSLVYGLMRFADTLILGAYWPAQDVGQYAALAPVSTLVTAWPAAASQSLGPSVSRFFHSRQVDGMIDALRAFVRSSMIASCFVFGGVAIFGERLDLIFGSAYSFEPLLCFLVPLGLLISAALAPLGFALSMTGRHKEEFGIAVFGCASLLLCGLWLTPRFGAVGAGLSVVLGFGVANGLRVLYIAHLYRRAPFCAADLAPVAISLATAFAARFASFGAEAMFWQTAAQCLLYGFFYAGTCFAFLARQDERSMIANWIWRGWRWR